MRPAAITISAALLSASLLAVQAQAQTQDRYGPDATATTLTWPGKTEPVDVAPPPPPAPPPLAPSAVVAADAPAPIPPLMPPPAPPIPVPYPTVGTAVVPPPPAAQPTQAAAVAQTGLPPRRYSVDRQYGVQPDPIPLPAQFFADQAASDLAAPPPPLDPHPVPGAQTVSSTASANTPANRARAIALDTASPDDTGQ